ncbi:hypothetical protein AB0C89_31035 [Streptomyces sp. NPDC048491]|uniref:hypothetical protein n=1 Tax=Streptomyces sp. NPDC048491 TaxID=3157207 RepID=UPI0034309CD8
MENLNAQASVAARMALPLQLKVEDKAFGPIRAFCAEYLSALSFAQDGDSVVLHGGKTSMYDIATAPYFTDVKALIPMAPHEKAEARDKLGYEADWKLFVPGSGEFPTVNEAGTAQRTHLGFVRLTAGYSANWTGAKLVIEAEPAQFLCSWIPTDDVNAQIAGYAGTMWYVPNDWLESYPVYRLKDAVTNGETAAHGDDLL